MTSAAAFSSRPHALGGFAHSYLPSPSQGVWHLGPLPIRAYALCIIAGVFIAIWLTDRRWRQRGGSIGTVGQVATWAVPFGLVGGRLYHLITDPELYFKRGQDWVHAFYVWNGGLGIWGAIALGALGAYIGCRRAGASFPAFADAAAPGIVFAQAIGRFGNYFNQELFGKPTTMPWGLKIDASHAANAGLPAGVYQPTFLYESVWDVGTGLLVLWADRRFRLGHGRAFLLYVMAYTAGRGWIEYLRVDHANHILGLRLNDWTSLLLFVGALVAFVISARWRPGRETQIESRVVAADASSVEPDTATVSDAAVSDAAVSDAGVSDAAVSDGAVPPAEPAEPSEPSELSAEVAAPAGSPVVAQGDPPDEHSPRATSPGRGPGDHGAQESVR